MKVQDARAAALSWVKCNARAILGYVGAYNSGSILTMPFHAPLPPGSDVDIMVVLDQPEIAPKLGKFQFNGALLEVTFVNLQQLGAPEQILSDYHLAGPFRVDNAIIDDPTGSLAHLQRRVAPRFAEPYWVRQRLQQVRRRIETGLRSLDLNTLTPDGILAWLFPTGVTAHLFLVAALHNPTVRRRYIAAREIMQAHAMTELYEELLTQLGVADFSRSQMIDYLDELTVTFDVAAALHNNDYSFSSDISPAARAIAIDGTQDMIDAGDHREAAFWLAVTFARSHVILAADAPSLHRQHMPAVLSLAHALGIATPQARQHRAATTLAALPRIYRLADALIDDIPARDQLVDYTQ